MDLSEKSPYKRISFIRHRGLSPVFYVIMTGCAINTPAGALYL